MFGVWQSQQTPERLLVELTLLSTSVHMVCFFDLFA